MIYVSRVDTQFTLTLGADLLIAFQLAVAILKREAHGARTRFLAMTLVFGERIVGQVELYVHGANEKPVAVVQRDDFALVDELVLVMQPVGAEDFDAEVAMIKVKEDLGVVPRDAFWALCAGPGRNVLGVDGHQRTVVRILWNVAVELGRNFRKGLHDHVLWRSLRRLLLDGFAVGVGGGAVRVRGIALAALLVLDGHRLDWRVDDATLLADDTARCSSIALSLLVLVAIEQLFGGLGVALCLQLVDLGQAAHVAVGEGDVATQDDLVCVHVVGAIVEAQARKGIDSLVADGGLRERDGVVERDGRGQVQVVVGRSVQVRADGEGRHALRRGSSGGRAFHVDEAGNGRGERGGSWGRRSRAVVGGMVGAGIFAVAGRGYEHAAAAMVVEGKGAGFCAKSAPGGSRPGRAAESSHTLGADAQRQGTRARSRQGELCSRGRSHGGSAHVVVGRGRAPQVRGLRRWSPSVAITCGARPVRGAGCQRAAEGAHFVDELVLAPEDGIGGNGKRAAGLNAVWSSPCHRVCCAAR